MTIKTEVFVPLSELIEFADLPLSLIIPESGDFLDELALLYFEETGSISDFLRADFEEDEPSDSLEPDEEVPTLDKVSTISLGLKVVSDIRLALPFVDGMALVLGQGDGQDTGLIEIDFSIDARQEQAPRLNFEFRTTTASLTIPNSILTPVKIDEGNGDRVIRPLSGENISIPLVFGIKVQRDERWTFDFDTPVGETAKFSLPPCIITGTDIFIESATLLLDLSGEERCIVLQWQEQALGSRLNALSSALTTENGNAVQITARIILGDPINEIFLEWQETSKRTFVLPGVSATIPGQTRYGIVLGNDPTISPSGINRLAFILTLPSQGMVTAQSTFAWSRNGERELQNEQQTQNDAKEPLFKFDLTNKLADPASLVLLSVNLQKFELPTFLKQLETPIPDLALPTPDRTDEEAQQFCTPIGLNTISLRSENEWDTHFNFALDQFELPFLKQSKSPNGENGLEQFVRIDTPQGLAPTLDFAKQSLTFTVGITLKLGSIELNGELALGFNWESFALEFDHGEGLKLISSNAVLPPAELLGLQWTFHGKDIGGGRYHYFTLSTQNYNYGIQQAPGAVIELSYTGISSDPLIFRVTNFAITDKGLSLRTTVVDAPVRLNGLDTKFRFDGSGIVIENSRIKSFAIAGAGALPPDLVGDSRVNIVLQFDRLKDGGKLTLVSGEAKLEGTNLLSCPGTRFKFSVDALGIKFVNDGKFHLYFTITGSAQFVLTDGDDAEGALALLPKIKLDLIDAPLTGDISVIGKHINFLVELPKPVSFNFLGCFEFELRGVGFEPQAEVFGGDGAMVLSGQLKFAQGGGDIVDARIDFHNLHIGLPAPGEFLPRVYFKQLAVSLAISGAFKLNAVVDFRNETNEKGFLGEGMVDIQGLPSFAGAFGFLRVRRDESSPWLRAWFIYLEVRKVSFVIPVVQIYLREVGLGFGYRFTLTSIKAADQEGDIRKLLKELRALSRTQGDLSKRDRWAVDLEGPGQDPRWTIVLRAMISQTAASSPLTYSEASEQDLSCIYLFDAVIAFRSDFTFFMAVRGWFNTNYNDYLVDDKGIRNKPLLSGFVLLAPRQKRFLANVSSNPEGKLGRHPELPDFVKSAIEAAEFSATLLIEPGLLHYEMGWPNMLRWKGKLGPIEVEFQGGFIFRISKTELVTGTSFMARGTLDVEAGISFGFFGVSVALYARVAYGARYIGVLAFQDIAANSAFYGAIGLELYVRITIRFWIKLLFFKKSFKFSIGVGFTAALEVGILGNLEPGIRGQGTISLKAMGRSIRFGVKVGINTSAVDKAIERTNRFLNIGLESTEVEALPGLSPSDPDPEGLAAAGTAFARRALAAEPVTIRAATSAVQKVLSAPNYTLFIVRLKDESYFVLIPAGERQGTTGYEPESGFLPAPLERKTSSILPSAIATTLDAAAATVDHRLATDLVTEQKNDNTGGEPVSIVKSGSTVRVSAWNKEQGAIEWIVREPAEDGQAVQKFRIIAETFNNRSVLGIYIIVDTSMNDDFTLDMRDVQADDKSILNHFNPTTQQWQPVGESHSWRVNWQASIVKDGQDFSDQPPSEEGEKLDDRDAAAAITLAEYLRGAFVECPGGVLADPQVIDEGKAMRDERVYNPTDGAFESAVRGAFEQFRGAPFFKRDPNNSYDQALESAFSKKTSIYSTVDTETEAKLSAAQNENADQVRGLITHDLVADLQEYIELLQTGGQDDEARAAALTKFAQESLAFQLGLVFQVTGPTPPWLDMFGDSTIVLPKITQRLGADPNAPQGEPRIVYPFNTSLTSFRTNPPRFDQVRHYANSTTVGIAWDLTWDDLPGTGCTPCQAEPEHHLLRYEVRRRALDSQTRDAIFSVKSGEIIQGPEVDKDGIAKPGIIQRLRPRFQLVDNFDDLNADEVTRLPAQGLTYLYTITPIDFAKNAGRSLTVVATRYPDQPPQVPTNGELTVTYQLARTEAEPEPKPETTVDSTDLTPIPPIVMPTALQIQWSDPKSSVVNRGAPIRDYQLVFRREETLPIGSYGLDSATQREKTQLLPTTNARVRPTDIVVTIARGQIGIVQQLIDAGVEGTKHDRSAPLDLADLQKLAIVPANEAPQWRPEAWRLFFRTVSDGGVPSALAPVQLKLRIISSVDETPLFRPLPEERRPAELEWVPTPIQLPLLPAEDQKGLTGDAHFPMPLVDGIDITMDTVADWRVTDFNSQVGFQPHPKRAPP